MSPEELCERWQIGTEQAKETISKTTQRLNWSSVMPLARQYNADRLFHTKRLAEIWTTDTMDGWVKTLDINQYAQVFSSATYFAEIHPMAKKADAGQAIKTFELFLSCNQKQTNP